MIIPKFATILVVPVVVWLTRPPVGVVPRCAVGPPPGALTYRISRTDPHIGDLRDDGPRSGVLRGAVDACEIAAERLARCSPSRPRADVWYVHEWRGRLAFNARHPVEAEEDSQPDPPLSTSRLRPSSPTPTCSMCLVSHRARTQSSKQPHQPYDEASHRKEDHREQASESTHLALESGVKLACVQGRRGGMHQRRRWQRPRWRGCGRWRQRRRGR